MMMGDWGMSFEDKYLQHEAFIPRSLCTKDARSQGSDEASWP